VKNLLLTSCCTLIASLSVCGLAAAQPAPSSAPGLTQGVSVGEVIVTAQRRAERLQDVPITITSVSSQQLKDANIQNLAQIQKVTPAMRFDNQGPFYQATIRGIGTAIVTTGSGSNVGIYIDGFYSPNPVASDFQLLNVENVQVLKGPQGTLFGRNTTGGAILVSTGKPSQDRSGMVDLSYGSYNAQRYEGYFTTGITDRVAFDIAGEYARGDGFTRNIATGDDNAGRYENWSLRTGLKVDVTNDVSVLLRYQHSRTDDPYSQLNGIYVYQGQPLTMAALFPSAIIATKPNEVSLTDPVFAKSSNDAYQMTWTANLDFGTLTSYTQYRNEKSVFQQDFNAATPNFIVGNVPIQDQTFTQEFLLTSKPGPRLQWTTGAFLMDYRDRFQAFLSIASAPFIKVAGSYTDTRSAAFFLDTTYQLAEKWYLTAGARYSHDVVRSPFYETPTGAAVFAPVMSSDRVTPRFVVRYAPDNQSSVYASFTRGYKAGIYNLGGQSTDAIAPESVNAYEVGYKHAERTFSVDAAAFYYDYKDLQVASYGVANGVPVGIVTNAAKARIYGVEGQVRWQPVRDFEVNASAAYVDAKYQHFFNDPAFTPCFPPSLPAVCTAADIGNLKTTPIPDAENFDMQRAPKWTANLGARYTADLAGGQLALSGTLYYTSKVYFDTAQQISQDGYATLGLRAEWTDPSERYVVAIYGDNVTNRHYYTQAIPETVSAPVSWSAPATVAGEIRVRFH
jgi:iron complex outermembrane receptor protein